MMRSSTPSNRAHKMIAPGPGGEVARARLRQRRAARTHQQARARIVLGRGGVDRLGKDVGAHHHAGAAAGRRVVHRSMPVGREVADLDRASSDHVPDSSKAHEPASDRPSAPGNISG